MFVCSLPFVSFLYFFSFLGNYTKVLKARRRNTRYFKLKKRRRKIIEIYSWIPEYILVSGNFSSKFLYFLSFLRRCYGFFLCGVLLAIKASQKIMYVYYKSSHVGWLQTFTIKLSSNCYFYFDYKVYHVVHGLRCLWKKWKGSEKKL